ncbi:MAG: DUF4374 domain-containing protein [Rikenellaceae bacterium]
MKKITIFAVAALALFAACTTEDSVGSDNNSDSGSSSDSNSLEVDEMRFAITTQTTSASTGDSVMVLLTSETLDEGSISVIGQGTELSTSASEWSHSLDNKYFYSIKDNGGTDATDVVQYYLDAASGMMKVRRQYSAAAYHTWGMWGDKFATTRNLSSSLASDFVTVTGNTDGSIVDVSGDYYAAISLTSYCDPEGTQATTNYYYTNNYIGEYVDKYNNGETATVVGFTTAGDYVYASYATTGVTRYTIEKGADYGWDGSNSDYIAQGNGSYTNSIDASNSFSATSGVPFPLTPGSAFIARYPLSGSFESEPTFITTDKMGQAFGRTTGNPLNTVVSNDDDEYVYIFTPGTTRRYSQDLSSEDDVEIGQYVDTTDESTLLDSKLKVKTTNKGASVMRIKYGEDDFDSSFGVDGLLEFESLMDNYTFSRVWHIEDSKFLLRVIHTQYLYNASHKTDVGDADFYIFDVDTKSATKVTGLPNAETDFVDQGSSSIGEPYIENGKAYVPMAPNTLSYPCIYIIDSATASATMGLEVQCSSILSIGKLIAQ